MNKKVNSKDPRRFFNAAQAESVLTLEVYDVIGADFFGDGITASAVSDAIAQAGTHDSISLRINSPGGDAFEGVAIYNVLKNNAKPVNVYVDGLAASAASIVAMAGDTICMGTGAMMMIHPAQGCAMGDAKAVREFADTLDQVSASIADIYVERTKNSKKSVTDMMNAETWMSAKEAVKNGFATSVADTSKMVSNAFDLSQFKNVPVELKNQAKTKEVDGEHLTAGDFVYVGNADDTSTWSLPWHFSSDEKTKSHLRDALARFDQDEVIPASHKDEAYAKLLRLCGEYGIEVSQRGKAKNEAPSFDAAAHDIRMKQIQIARRK
jgi:ATP-dependent protease ClpP protease subunit